MVWIFVTLGTAAALLGLTLLTAPLPTLRLPRPRPRALLRGCLALLCLAAALACAGLALLVAPWLP